MPCCNTCTGSNSNPCGDPSNCEWQCTKKRCADEVTTSQPDETSQPDDCEQTDPTTQLERSGSVTRPIKKKTLENILEIQIIGFEDELGQPTFEEIENRMKPSMYLKTLTDVTTIPPCDNKKQYTSDYTRTGATAASMMNTQTAISQGTPLVTSQDPDGITWISQAQWDGSTWDHIPLLDTENKTIEEVCAWLRPENGYILRGLREVFYKEKPFADNANPTPGEIDAWNIKVIIHFRALLGNKTPVRNDARLYLESRWAHERKFTESWDSAYPLTGTIDDNRFGPCFSSPGVQMIPDKAEGHCGESFFPLKLSERERYVQSRPYNTDYTKYPELKDYFLRRSQASGLHTVKANIPWSIKLSHIIIKYACEEGLHSNGHIGPYLTRQEFGCSWWHTTGNDMVDYRGKWR